MNYSKHYNLLIEGRRKLNRSRKDGIFANHHIIPRCMDGSDNKDNLVLLKHKEHLLAHILLCEIYLDHKGLTQSIFFMWYKDNPNKSTSCKIYEKIMETHIKNQSISNSGEKKS